MYVVYCVVNVICVGDCDFVIVVVGNWIVDFMVQIVFDKFGVLFVLLRCYIFDVRVEGYVCGEGWGVIYLKRFLIVLVDNLFI